MGLIRYSCGQISGHHEPIHVKFWYVWVVHHVLLKYGHENAEMQKRKFDDVTLQYSMGPRTLIPGTVYFLTPDPLHVPYCLHCNPRLYPTLLLFSQSDA